jgi:hypothetical protein
MGNCKVSIMDAAVWAALAHGANRGLLIGGYSVREAP